LDWFEDVEVLEVEFTRFCGWVMFLVVEVEGVVCECVEVCAVVEVVEFALVNGVECVDEFAE